MRARKAPIELRPGGPGDAVTIAALAVQVFLDTYATDGVRPDLAREAFREYSEQAFARLHDPNRSFVLADAQAGLVGFAELHRVPREAPLPGLPGGELVRLYVQPQAQRSGFGTALLQEAEKRAFADGTSDLWLAVWEGNARARKFYASRGYVEVGETTYAFEGRTYGNRILAKRLSAT